MRRKETESTPAACSLVPEAPQLCKKDGSGGNRNLFPGKNSGILQNLRRRSFTGRDAAFSRDPARRLQTQALFGPMCVSGNHIRV